MNTKKSAVELPQISQEEFLELLEEARPGTPEMLPDYLFKIVDKARNHERPVPWVKIVELVNSHYGFKFTNNALRSRYHQEKQKREFSK